MAKATAEVEEIFMKIEMRKLSEITPYPNNPRCNDHAVANVAESIQLYGFRQPLVLDENRMIIVGHTRYKAALKLGLAEVPCHIAVGLTLEQARAYRLRDNQSATLATWDDGKLLQELMGLQEAGCDLDMAGFTDDDLSRLLADAPTEGSTDPDSIPEPPDEPVTQPGDMWLMDQHRLLCGDSGKVDDVDRLVDGRTIHLVNTDPPYGVNVEPRSRRAIAAGLSSFAASRPALVTERKLRARDRPLVNDFTGADEFVRLLRAWFANLARALAEGRSYYIWGGFSNISNYPTVLAACGLHFSQTIIWDKQHPVLTRKDYMGAHEWCFYGWREGRRHQFYGPNNATDLWSIQKVNPQKMQHLTEKPVELAERAILYSSKPAENVLDLFAGAGWTLVAAQKTNRNAFLMEIDPAYCDVVVKRWQEFTGRTAQRIAANEA